MMNMVKRFISTLVLVVALVGTVSAQNLDDLSKKVYDLSFGVINKGINAYEEQLEKQELEEVKKALEDNFEENCNILYDVAIGYFLEHDAWVKCYCDPVGDYIWYTIFYGDDNNWWINLAYDSNGSISETFYTTKIKSSDYLIFKDDISGKKIAAIKLDYIIILQDAHNPETFTINW